MSALMCQEHQEPGSRRMREGDIDVDASPKRVKSVARITEVSGPEVEGKIPLRFVPTRSFFVKPPERKESIWTGNRVENGEGVTDLVCDAVVQVIERGSLYEDLYLLESGRIMDASGLVNDGQHALGGENELSVEYVKREIYYRKIRALTCPMVLSRLTEPELTGLMFEIVNRVQRLGVSGTSSGGEREEETPDARIPPKAVSAPRDAESAPHHAGSATITEPPAFCEILDLRQD